LSVVVVCEEKIEHQPVLVTTLSRTTARVFVADEGGQSPRI